MKFLVAGLFRLLNLIPDRWAVHLADGIAMLLVRFNTDMARVSRINIAHCFPDLDQVSQDEHVRASLTHATLLLFEFAYLQYRPIDKLLEKISGVDGEQRLQRASQEGNGVILLMPHFGCWEFLSIYLGRVYPISALYDPPNMAALEESIVNTRQRQGANMYPTNASGLRGLMRGLKAGDVVVVLPDQVPAGKSSGVIAPFFGQDALTMLLGKRLMNVGRPAVLMAAAWRELSADGIRYRLSFDEPAEGLSSDREDVHAAALNAGIETIVRRDPAQYQWSYKRFRRLGESRPDLYRRQ